MDIEDRIRLSDGVACGAPCAVANYWVEHFSFFAEMYQGAATRFPGALGEEENRTCARLDRIYFTKELESFSLLDIRVSTWGLLPDPFRSDHLAVTAASGYRTKPKGFPNIPHFVCKHTLFAKIVDSICVDFAFSNCCFARLSEMKSIFREAFIAFKQNSANRGSQTSKERIFWSLQALRGNDSRNFQEMKKAFIAAPQLLHDDYDEDSDASLSSAHVSHIRRILNDSLKMSEQELRAELQAAQKLPEYASDKVKQGLMAQLARHNPKHQKMGIEAVKGDDGMPIFNKSEAHSYLGRFWGKQFCEKHIDEHKAKDFCEEFSNKIPAQWRVSSIWLLPFQLFLLLLCHVKKSAPGPDGIPYSAWACSSLVLQVCLLHM